MSVADLKTPVRTRDDLARLALGLFECVQPHYSLGRARLRLGSYTGDFDTGAAELEGFSRVLWGLAPLLKGGFDVPFWPEVLKGIEAGTDPAHPEYWGAPVDYDQRIVESAAISFTIILVPAQSWQKLSTKGKANLVTWLEQVVAANTTQNNWVFFTVLAHLALRSIGQNTDDDAVLSGHLDFLESCAVGPDGWVTDGHRPQADHYVGFALHYYALLYMVFAGETDPDRTARMGDRARRFALHFREWFADDGAALPYGRSLPYRFAHGSFWGAVAFADCSPFSPGATRELLMENMRWWQATDMLDRDGVLSVGGTYQNANIAEFYSSAQSPYWAFKIFLPLALPADHPFWTAPAETAPSSDGNRIQPVPGMILQRHKGDVTALSAGQEAADLFLHTAEKYGKFAYSTRYGYGIERDGRNFLSGAFDNMLACSRDGVHFAVRKRCEQQGIVDGQQYARWRTAPDVVIETVTIPCGVGHLRAHRIVTDVALHLAEGGFALPSKDRHGSQVLVEDATITLRQDLDVSAIKVLAAPSDITLQRQVAAPGSHFYFPRSVVPQVRLQVPIGVHILTCWFGAAPDAEAVLAGIAGAQPLKPDLFDKLREAAHPPEGWNADPSKALASPMDRDRSLDGPRT